MIRLSEIENAKDYVPEYIIDNLLAISDLSILAGNPKVGKSTLAKYLMARVSQGEPFAHRTTGESICIYYSYESREQIVASAIAKFNPRMENIYAERVIGSLSPNKITDDVIDTGASFIIIDTLSHMLNITDLNNYQLVARALQPYVDLVSQLPVHLMLLHHIPKNASGINLLGAQSIRGATGSNWMYRTVGTKRVLYTEQREMMGVPLPELWVTLRGDSLEFERKL